jgi:hypothetical protein
MTLSRSSLKRKAPLGQRGPILKSTSTFRQRKCSVCAKTFKPQRMGMRVCSPECAAVQGAKDRQIQVRVADRERKQALKTKGEWIAEVQTLFNRLVRLEDHDLPCISCGKFVIDDGRPGGVWDAGHYLARGGSPHLRFDRRNVHKQCKACNRPGGTMRAVFRAGMIERIGLAAVEALEADQDPRHYTIEDLKQMKADLTAKLRALKEKS